jgi:hypothetical protein
MNSTLTTLVLTHAPIGVMLIGISVLVVALQRRAVDLRRAAYVFFIVGALVAIPAFFSGYSDEIVPIGSDYFNPMKLSLLVSEILGGLSLAALVLDRLRLQFFAPAPELIVIVGALTTASLTYSTDFGDRARHAEPAHSGFQAKDTRGLERVRERRPQPRDTTQK